MGLMSQKFESSIYESFLHLKISFALQDKVEARKSRAGEQVRGIGENWPKNRGAVHWASGTAHIAGAAH